MLNALPLSWPWPSSIITFHSMRTRSRTRTLKKRSLSLYRCASLWHEAVHCINRASWAPLRTPTPGLLGYSLRRASGRDRRLLPLPSHLHAMQQLGADQFSHVILCLLVGDNICQSGMLFLCRLVCDSTPYKARTVLCCVQNLFECLACSGLLCSALPCPVQQPYSM